MRRQARGRREKAVVSLLNPSAKDANKREGRETSEFAASRPFVIFADGAPRGIILAPSDSFRKESQELQPEKEKPQKQHERGEPPQPGRSGGPFEHVLEQAHAGPPAAPILKPRGAEGVRMVAPLRHEEVGPGLHRFVFPSERHPGVTYELLVDLHDEGEGRYSCLCDAGLHGKRCKHVRYAARFFSDAEGAAGA